MLKGYWRITGHLQSPVCCRHEHKVLSLELPSDPVLRCQQHVQLTKDMTVILHPKVCLTNWHAFERVTMGSHINDRQDEVSHARTMSSLSGIGSGNGKISVLYQNKTTTPKSVKDPEFDGLFLTVDLHESLQNEPFNFVLLDVDGTWSNSAALYRRLKNFFGNLLGHLCLYRKTTWATVVKDFFSDLLDYRCWYRQPTQTAFVKFCWRSGAGLLDDDDMADLYLSRKLAGASSPVSGSGRQTDNMVDDR